MANDKLIKKIALGNNEYGVFAADQNTEGKTLLTAESINENEGELKQLFINLCYPIGSIYITRIRNFNPNDAFGGTGRRIEDSFLKGANSSASYDMSQMFVDGDGTEFLIGGGGQNSITLKEENLPPHSHFVPMTGKEGSRGRLAIQSDGHPVYYQYTDATTFKRYDFGIGQVTNTSALQTNHYAVDISPGGTTGIGNGSATPIEISPTYTYVAIGERIA